MRCGSVGWTLLTPIVPRLYTTYTHIHGLRLARCAAGRGAQSIIEDDS